MRHNDNRISKQNFELSLTSPATSGPENHKEITDLKEVEEKGIMTKTIPDAYGPSNPYPIQAPSHVLGRKYRVATFNWQVGLIFQQTLNFPAALLSVPAIAEYLQLFLFMRAGVEIDVRINSSSFHYGALMASWIPNHVGSGHALGIHQQSGNHPVVLSASLQQAATIEIPWINNFLYFPIASGTSEICRFYLSDIAQLERINDTTTDTIEVQVFAAFKNIDLAGYQPLPPFMQAQSGRTFSLADLNDPSTMEAEDRKSVV